MVGVRAAVGPLHMPQQGALLNSLRYDLRAHTTCTGTRLRPWITGAVLCAYAACGSGLAESQRVGVVYGAKGPYSVAARKLAEDLGKSGYECRLFELPPHDDAAQKKVIRQLVSYEPAALATGGTTATMMGLESLAGVPVIAFMVPNALDAPFLQRDYAHRERVVCVPSDIDPATQVEWIARTRPGCKRIAIPCSARTSKTVASITQAGQARGLDLKPVETSANDIPKLIDTLGKERFDGLLMIPDGQVYNSPNVQRILLWGVRQKKPVWAFSTNVVKAGAFSGVSCDSAAVGAQSAAMVTKVLKGARPATLGVQYPEHVDHAVNVHTAEMIEAPLDGDAFDKRVARLGERP